MTDDGGVTIFTTSLWNINTNNNYNNTTTEEVGRVDIVNAYMLHLVGGVMVHAHYLGCDGVAGKLVMHEKTKPANSTACAAAHAE